MTEALQESIEQWNASPAGEVWEKLRKRGFRCPAQGDTWARNLLRPEKFNGDIDAVVDYIENFIKGWKP